MFCQDCQDLACLGKVYQVSFHWVRPIKSKLGISQTEHIQFKNGPDGAGRRQFCPDSELRCTRPPPPLPTVRGKIPSGPCPSKFVDFIQAGYHAKHIFSNFGSLSMKFVVNFNLVFRMGPSGQFYWTIL